LDLLRSVTHDPDDHVCHHSAATDQDPKSLAEAPVETTTLCNLLLALIVVGSCPSFATETQSGDAAPCQPLAFASNRYVVCGIDLRHDDVQMLWDSAQGKPFGTIRKFAAGSTQQPSDV
jgi:uncharacterized protein YigE (DUF2233 family)